MVIAREIRERRARWRPQAYPSRLLLGAPDIFQGFGILHVVWLPRRETKEFLASLVVVSCPIKNVCLALERVIISRHCRQHYVILRRSFGVMTKGGLRLPQTHSGVRVCRVELEQAFEDFDRIRG